MFKPYEVGDADLNFWFQEWSCGPVLAGGNTPSC